MPPCLRCHGEEGKRGGVWAPRRLVLDAAVKKGNEAACGIHAASSSMTQGRGETRRRVGSTLLRLRCPREEGKRGGVWVPHRLVFNAPGKRGNKAACELHTASSSMPQKRGEARRRVGSTPPRLRCPRKEGKRGSATPPRLQCRRKEWKRGGVWTPHRLVFDATGRINEAACGFHAVSLLMLQEGGETTRRRVGFTRPRWVLDSSLVLVVLLAPTPRCSPPCSPSLTTGC
jgi:hypothetical protein